jgi:hypothetical protein
LPVARRPAQGEHGRSRDGPCVGAVRAGDHLHSPMSTRLGRPGRPRTLPGPFIFPASRFDQTRVFSRMMPFVVGRSIVASAKSNLSSEMRPSFSQSFAWRGVIPAAFNCSALETLSAVDRVFAGRPPFVFSSLAMSSSALRSARSRISHAPLVLDVFSLPRVMFEHSPC